MTWDRAAGNLGWMGRGRARRLKRMVFARERETGKRIATRMGTKRKPAYKVSLSALRRHLPELFKSKVDELEAVVTGYLAGIDERIAGKVADHVDEYVEPRLDELWQRDEKIAGQVMGLAAGVEALSKVVMSRPRSTTIDRM